MQSSQLQSGLLPLAFRYLRIYDGRVDKLAGSPFLTCGMLTASYSAYADRLAHSLQKHRLPYILYEVPAVHQSISPKGMADPSYTKANFIYFLLETHKKPILYVDVDCVLTANPDRVGQLVRDGYDFAVYNWLADEHTESYKPVPVKLTVDGNTIVVSDRFYRFSHSIDYFSVDQLICSGAVQFYKDTEAARALLRRWHEVILQHPHTADDQCLDYAFNNPRHEHARVRAAWLDKAYARYAWWIYEQPVINHPEFPYGGSAFRKIKDRAGVKRFYPERAHLRAVDYFFPKDCLIDTREGQLLRIQGNRLTPWRPVTKKLWL